MKGLKVTGTFNSDGLFVWPKEFKRLDGILGPLVPQLDRCWWYLGHGGVSLEANSSDTAEYEQAMRELGQYMDEESHDFVLGRPGFFGRYGGGLSGDWHIYLAADSTEPPIAVFSEITRLQREQRESNRAWWDERARPPDLAGDLCLLARGVDSAYWEIFFRDDEMFDRAWRHVSGKPHLRVDVA